MASRPQVLAIPLQHWNTAIADINGEPILILDLSNGTRVAVMMPSATAREMGTALQQLAEKTTPPPSAQRN
jgi:hypothetical protein